MDQYKVIKGKGIKPGKSSPQKVIRSVAAPDESSISSCNRARSLLSEFVVNFEDIMPPEGSHGPRCMRRDIGVVIPDGIDPGDVGLVIEFKEMFHQQSFILREGLIIPRNPLHLGRQTLDLAAKALGLLENSDLPQTQILLDISTMSLTPSGTSEVPPCKRLEERLSQLWPLRET